MTPHERELQAQRDLGAAESLTAFALDYLHLGGEHDLAVAATALHAASQKADHAALCLRLAAKEKAQQEEAAAEIAEANATRSYPEEAAAPCIHCPESLGGAPSFCPAGPPSR